MGGVFRRVARTAAILAVVALGLTGADASARSAVTGARVGDHDATTRFVLDLSDRVDFKVFTLADPYRVIVDLPETDWQAATKGTAKPVGVVKTYHFGLFTANVGRIVVDLAGPAAVQQAFLIAPREGAGWRLVVDLAKSTREAFLKTQTAPPGGAAPTPVSVPAPVPPPPPAVADKAPTVAISLPLPQPKPADAKAAEPRAKPEAKPAAEGKVVIVLDPGHGGVDPGAIGVSGVYEKNITLAMAREAKAAMEKTGRFKVVLTRDQDVFIPLRERVQRARQAGADLFISLHADVVQHHDIKGLSVYTLSQNASDAEAQALADKENKADLIGGMDLSRETPEVTNILIDLAQRETMNLSAGFAGELVEELGREIPLLSNTHRFAGFAVLKAPDVPSVLIELGYLSNDGEEQLLRKPDYRAKLAVALARSVERYFSQTQKTKRP